MGDAIATGVILLISIVFSFLISIPIEYYASQHQTRETITSESSSSSNTSSDLPSFSSSMTTYLQRTFSLTSRSRGCHLITDEVLTHLSSDLNTFSIGLLNLFLLHTSASLTINENYDKDVPRDMEEQLNRMVKENERWRHDTEGKDDMPAHVKSSLFGVSLTIPITDGRLALGTWQGIWFCEHRNNGGQRQVVATMHGVKKETNTQQQQTHHQRR